MPCSRTQKEEQLPLLRLNSSTFLRKQCLDYVDASLDIITPLETSWSHPLVLVHQYIMEVYFTEGPLTSWPAWGRVEELDVELLSEAPQCVGFLARISWSETAGQCCFMLPPGPSGNCIHCICQPWPWIKESRRFQESG